MFTLTKEFRFEAAHMLPHHDGKCRRLHGHSWKMRVELRKIGLEVEGPKRGMLMDFGDISKAIQPLLETRLDHHYLNETTGLENPTSEEVARWVFNHLEGELAYLHAVEIDETCTSSCRYEL